MPSIRIKRQTIESLLAEGKIRKEMCGDSETGRVIFDHKERKYFYAPTPGGRFYKREFFY